MTLENVSDTARWVAHYRALESERPDALFRDPYAAALAGPRAAGIVKGLAGGRAAAWGLIVRTRVFDELIAYAIERDRVDTVVNLGAGLDARPFRLTLPPALRWIEIDLPEILAHKAAVLRGERPRCDLETVGVDLRDAPARRATFADVSARGRRILVLCEGLLVYMPPEDVVALDEDLRQKPAFALWATDIASPWYVRRQLRQWGNQLAKADALWRFAPPEGAGFFTSRGWTVLDARSPVTDGLRLRRLPHAWLARMALTMGPSGWRRSVEQSVQYLLLSRSGTTAGDGEHRPHAD